MKRIRHWVNRHANALDIAYFFGLGTAIVLNILLAGYWLVVFVGYLLS